MIATQPKEQKKKELALGFIGVGWIGRNRMEAIRNNTQSRVASIVEPTKENAEEALKSAKEAKIISSTSEMLADEELDGIVIATPSAMHAQQSIEALKAGKAVFCQKPLGRTATEVREVVEASKEANKLLSVDLSYRYTKAFEAIYQLIRNGEIGDIYAVDLVFHNAYGPDKEWFYDIKRSGGGCVMDLGIHLVDLALWSLDFPKITNVRSHLFHQGKKLTSFEEQVEDFASVAMTSEKDNIINLECSWHVSAGRDAVIEARFYGTKGGAAFKNVNGSFYDFKAEKYTGTQTETLVTPPDEWSGRAGVVWANNVLENNSYAPQSGEEFIKTAEIIDRIYGR
ncbi:Gfo/Idh/MocA family oxidoreductase [Antarcticibacterium sp. 1MA-6-2]|uniref:Gfo/Idh/MocA family protein n=1 Tax=Antarcticibacterium sp. 1MA-6-2 TaxID=2908210 RepID=UPI001F43248C|nr:Gfo/Idh/MocA family oxidoreductase [Antarcticibacterium sp. 1MA-6-2]UJH90486.1 Gfo/Idh/MocA family oxidoreductase [Antarcticibacterium sp. 1MA-6-2]